MHQHPGSSAVRRATGRSLSKVGAGRETLVAGSVVGCRQAVHGYLLSRQIPWNYFGAGWDRIRSGVDGVSSATVVIIIERWRA
jgi:hypothetical protein